MKRLWKKILFLCALFLLNCNCMRVCAEEISAATALAEGVPVEVTDTYYSFTTQESGNYKIHLINTEKTDSSYSIRLYLYDINGNLLCEYLNWDEIFAYRHLEAGELCYIKACADLTSGQEVPLQISVEEYAGSVMNLYKFYTIAEPVYLYKDSSVILNPHIYAGEGRKLTYEWYKKYDAHEENGEWVGEEEELIPETTFIHQLKYGEEIADRYICIATDDTGASFTKEFRVYDSLELKTGSDSYSFDGLGNSRLYISEGEKVTMIAEASAIGNVEAKWYKRNMSKNSWDLMDGGESSEERHHECVEYTYSCDVSERGMYRCVITASLDFFETESTIVEFLVCEEMVSLPIELTAETSKVTIKYNLPVELKANLKILDPAYENNISFVWCKVLDENDDMEEDENQELIENADSNVYTTTEPGYYLCYAVDELKDPCIEYGYQTYVLFEVKKDDTPCTHVWDDGVVVKNPTATKKGEKLYTCKQCKITKVEKFGPPKKGSVLTDSAKKAKYKVTKAGKTVEYVAPLKKKSTVEIPATVKIEGITYKVTGIAKYAFKNNKKIQKVIIGKNISQIGKQAFYGCKKLKTITINTKSLTLKKVGSKAFQGIYSKAKIYVPKKNIKAYKSILKKRGAGSRIKVKRL